MEGKYAELFATEAREHLEQIDRALLALESEPDDPEALDAVFRSVHTIKGMAGAMGYDAVQALCHGIESALDPVRSGAIETDTELIDELLESGDLLKAAVEAAVAGEDAPDTGGAIERLERVARERSGAPTRRPRKRQAARSRTVFRPGASRVRVDIRRLDALMDLIGELLIVRGRLGALADELGAEPLTETLDQAGRLIGEMQAQVIESRMVPLWQVFDRFPRLVRDVARSLDKEIGFEVSGKDLEVDRSLLDAIGDPLLHLIRNAADHGIETPAEREELGKPKAGRIELSARRERSRILVTVRDDGRGVDRDAIMERARELGLLGEETEPDDQELFRLLARPGFSTADRVTEVSGRGVGLNVVDDCIRAFGGSVRLSSEPGAGTEIQLELPLTVAIVRALLVEVADQEYALPVTFTRASFEAKEESVQRAHGREWIGWREELLPLTRLRELFGADEPGGPDGSGPGPLKLVALEFGTRRLAVAVDRFVAEEEIVVKAFDPPRGALPLFSGATVRSNGRPALILDVGGLS